MNSEYILFKNNSYYVFHKNCEISTETPEKESFLSKTVDKNGILPRMSF